MLIHVLQALCPVLTYLIHIETILLNLEFGNQTLNQQINLSITFHIFLYVQLFCFLFPDWSARDLRLRLRSPVTTLTLLSYHRLRSWLLFGKFFGHRSHQLSYKLLLLNSLLIFGRFSISHLRLVFKIILFFFLFLGLLLVWSPWSCCRWRSLTVP